MIYGLYLSAAGLVTNSYRQDVIANNIANSEAVGFKRDLAMIQQRPMADDEIPGGDENSDPSMQNLGGGMFAAPTMVDTRQGDMDPTGNNLDVAIQGNGYFAVNSGGKMRLTRNGQFVVDHTGTLALSVDGGPPVLDTHQAPIAIPPGLPVTIGSDGTVSQGGTILAKLGVFDVADSSQLKKEGGSLLSTGSSTPAAVAAPTVKSQCLERSNVDPATELTLLMDTQRQLEANANMIQTQDETLSKLVSDVGKIS
jgi:flagellar basal-body rod protein FlgF